jgi:hypothetical protein
MPQQNNEAASKVKHSEDAFSVTLISDNEAPKVLQPGKLSLDFPASTVSPQTAFVLCLNSSVTPVRAITSMP